MEVINSINVVAAILVAAVTIYVYILFHNRLSSDKTLPPKRCPTFRARGVPHDWDDDRLRVFLAEQPGCASPVVQSMTDENHGRSRTATVLFRNVPSQLQTEHSWKISLPTALNQSAGSITLDTSFHGITTLYAPHPQYHKVDIVAICGLGGHAFGSFKERDGEHMWLRDALPKDLRTGEGNDNSPARVMVYGYESSLLRGESFQNIYDLATAFRTSLLTLVGTKAIRPIIFIAHSLGGLVVKQTLISISKSEDERDKKLIKAVSGIAFFGVPHAGMDITSLIPIVKGRANESLLDSISNINSTVLIQQRDDFAKALGSEGEHKVICFYETEESRTAKQVKGKWRMDGPPAVLVTPASAKACPPWGDRPENTCAINRTHSGIVKFRPGDHEYANVLQHVEHLVQQALKGSPLPQLSKLAQDCLKSLAFPKMGDRSHDITSAVAGTCQWLGQHSTYASWVTSDHGLLWIKGKPGSGKSTLMKNILDNYRTGRRDLVLSFFFHGRGDDLQKTPLGLFRSLLHQVLRKTPDTLSDLVDTYGEQVAEIGEPDKKWKWQQGELQRFFELSLLNVLKTRSVWLFVDALDECGRDNAVNLIGIFKSLLKDLLSARLNQFRICFSCRHYPNLYLDDAFEVCLEKENEADISTFVHDQLSEFQVRTSSAIPALITERASGVFMWACLVVKQVLALELDGAEIKKIEAAIHSIPADLDELYRGLIRDMEPDSVKLIQWICFATRPLSLEELRWAMTVESNCTHRSLQAYQIEEDKPDNIRMKMKRKVQALSRGLAEVTGSSDTEVVQFIHQSVKDFFVEKGLTVVHIRQSVEDFLVEKGLSALDSRSTPIELVIGNAHHQLSRVCIRYLAMEEIGQSTSYRSSKIASDFPFLRYAMTSWVAHTKECDARSVPQEDLLELFAWPSNDLVEQWVRVYQAIDPYSKDCPSTGTSLVHIMSRYDVLGWLEAILQRVERQIATYVDTKDKFDRTPLSWAAQKGHEAIVRLLLEKGANIESADKQGRTPLSYAAQEEREDVTQLLLEKGANIESVDLEGRTPLSYAAQEGHTAATQLLLEKGANIESADGEGRPERAHGCHATASREGR